MMSTPMQMQKDKEEDKVEQGIKDHCVDMEQNYINKTKDCQHYNCNF